MNINAEMLASAVLIIGILCTAVSLFTQLTKSIGIMKKIPTKLYVIVVSQIFTLVSYFGYMAYKNIVSEWYMTVGAVFGGLFVAVVTTFGWETVISTFNRFKKQ